MPKKIVDAKNDADGNVKAVRLEGNAGFTPLETAIKMADKGQIEGAHVVRPKKGDAFLRSNPNKRKGDNLDEMAKD